MSSSHYGSQLEDEFEVSKIEVVEINWKTVPTVEIRNRVSTKAEAQEERAESERDLDLAESK